ncbi:MFS-type transporter SLC18B1-like isoform X1 [Dinothrombium tinctorium]|uniref:MFS-type transporter SLC18B1-like isoform X1 n=1 Tax=Dinothrombium tinctorium TaxID=1965070 RepID=A0A3S4R770_9ACAR|nr:MFS-type transporter SLC18B1-like isoform X1 [Dinothrombium tinctorium]
MFVEDLSKVTSYLELAYGIGFLTGPAVGSALYSSFDYIAPFIFNGALILLILPFTLLSIHRTLKNLQLRKFENEEEEQSETRNATYGSLLSDIPILFMCLVNFIANVCIEFFEPILGLYLIELKMKPQAVGFMYLFRSVTVTLCSPIVGHLLPFFQNKYSFILLGSSLQILALILLGPVRFIGVVDKNIYLIAVGIVLNACSVSFVFIATYEIIVKRVAYLGFEMDMKTNALISSLNITPYFIGMTFGFLISGTFYANFGFSLSASILIPLPLIALILQIISLIRFKEELLTESNEMLPLNSSCGDTATTNAIDCGTHIPQESAYGSTH